MTVTPWHRHGPNAQFSNSRPSCYLPAPDTDQPVQASPVLPIGSNSHCGSPPQSIAPLHIDNSSPISNGSSDDGFGPRVINVGSELNSLTCTVIFYVTKSKMTLASTIFVHQTFSPSWQWNDQGRRCSWVGNPNRKFLKQRTIISMRVVLGPLQASRMSTATRHGAYQGLETIFSDLENVYHPR